MFKLEDRGPVFFRQLRVGRDGKPITVHKLRTMCIDAEARFDEVRHLNERIGPLFKTESDPRVTRVGAFLRSTSLDEIPQLLDVLRGDMSLIGPRPALPAAQRRGRDPQRLADAAPGRRERSHGVHDQECAPARRQDCG